jgi:hypothetical protein
MLKIYIKLRKLHDTMLKIHGILQNIHDSMLKVQSNVLKVQTMEGGLKFEVKNRGLQVDFK